MIYIHNESITGINTHNKSIDRVYNGNRLVWLRNSTADSFTIVGADTVVESYSSTFRVSYAGSDDMLYHWSASEISAEDISIAYNHNRKKAKITVNKGSGVSHFIINVTMYRYDKDPLFCSKIVSVIEAGGITSFSISDVVYKISDSSVFVPFDIIPPEYKPICTIYDASISDSSLNLTNGSGYGIYIEKKHKINQENESSMTVSILDGYIIPEDELPDFENLVIVDTISDASGGYNEIYVKDVQKYYEYNNLYQYEEYGIMPTVSNLSDVTTYNGKLAINSTNNHQYKWDGTKWKDLGELLYKYNYESLSYNGDGTLNIPIDHYWGKNYTAILTFSATRFDAPNRTKVWFVKPNNILETSYATAPLNILMDHRNDPTHNYICYAITNPTSDSSAQCLRYDHSCGLTDIPLSTVIDVQSKYKFYAKVTNHATGSLIEENYYPEEIDGWYNGLYHSNICIDSSIGSHFIELKILDASGNIVNDFVPYTDTNGACIYDKALNIKYYSDSEDKKPVLSVYGYGQRIPIEKYANKYPADQIVDTSVGWQLLHTATAKVITINPTLSFSINGVDDGEGFDMTSRVQFGFATRVKGIKSIKLTANMNNYGISKLGSNTDMYYCSWACDEFDHRGSYISSSSLDSPTINWLQYNDGEHPYIPPVVSGEKSGYTWFYYFITDRDSTLSSDSRDDSIYSGHIIGYYTHLVFDIKYFGDHLKVYTNTGNSNQKTY